MRTFAAPFEKRDLEKDLKFVFEAFRERRRRQEGVTFR